jgi:hypothetical protein
MTELQNPGKELIQATGETRLRIISIPELRISVAALAFITDGQAKYALTVNANALKKGRTVLTPIGGAIKLTEEGKEQLEKSGIPVWAFEKENDMRFTTKGENSQDVIDWVLSCRDPELGLRESDPLGREFEEELLKELGLLPPEDLRRITFEKDPIGYYTAAERTQRAGQEGAPTLRIAEVYEVSMPPEVLNKLIEASEKTGAKIKFVTIEEIKRGITDDGIPIGSVAEALFSREKVIPPAEKIYMND